MISTFETVFLGVVEREGKNGPYHVMTFLDEGEAVSVMLSKDIDVRKLPTALTECSVTVSVSLGRYPDKKVLGVAYGRND